MNNRAFTVLVVDDEEIVRQTLAFALESGEVNVDCVDSAEAALVKIRARRYDLYIFDKNLPGKSGVDLLRQLRQDADDTRAFLITGYASTTSAIETLHLGIEGYIEKPFSNVFDLIDRVKASLALGRFRRMPSVSGATSHFNKVGEVFQDVNAALGRLRIIVGAADPRERAWLQTELGGKWDEVVMANCGREVLRQLEARPCDVLVIDRDLQDPDVFDILELVKRTKPQLLRIVTASGPTLSTVIRLIDLGVRAVLEKPVSKEALHEKIDALLNAARAAKLKDEPTKMNR
jgi:DNA-binding NtrC family response regulator